MPVPSLLKIRRSPACFSLLPVALVLWLVGFCQHCLALADSMAMDPAPGGHCQHDMDTSDDKLTQQYDSADGTCHGDCPGIDIAAPVKPVFQTGDDFYGQTSDDPGFAALLNNIVVTDRDTRKRNPPYTTPERAYFLPFSRYTVLLN